MNCDVGGSKNDWGNKMGIPGSIKCLLEIANHEFEVRLLSMNVFVCASSFLPS